MLPFRQKPKDLFKAPTYTMGGSNSSHTRQGGILLTILHMPVAMAFMLLGINLYKINENKVMKSDQKDFFIDFCTQNTLTARDFLSPKASLKPY